MDGKTRVCGLMANPVEHTLSPLLHNTLSKKQGLNRIYVPFKPVAEGLDSAVKGAYALNILGLNVSIPYKQEVMKSLCAIDENAARIGAVNTLVRMENGYKGYNTDLAGLKRALDIEEIFLNEQNVVILGAGGTAKTAAYLSCMEGASSVYLLNRTVTRAEQLAKEVNKWFTDVQVIPMALTDWPLLPEKKYLAIQTTSVGMHPNIQEAPIEKKEFYSRLHTAVDIIYTPFQTKFMEYAKKSGARTTNGLKMLLYQGIIAYELWNGTDVPEETAKYLYECMKKELLR